MSLPTFIQIGEGAETIYNVSQITAIQRRSIPVTEQNIRSYRGFTERIQDGMFHSIFVEVVGGRGGMEYIYQNEAKRDAQFEKIRAALKPLVLGDAPTKEK